MVRPDRDAHERDFTVRFRLSAVSVQAVPTIVVSARGEERLRSGHPWIYRADVADVRADAGDVVSVRGPRTRALGHAFYSDRSQIALRMLAYGDRAVDADALI